MDSLLRLSRRNGLECPSRNGPEARSESPDPGVSILMTRAPMSANCIVA